MINHFSLPNEWVKKLETLYWNFTELHWWDVRELHITTASHSTTNRIFYYSGFVSFVNDRKKAGKRVTGISFLSCIIVILPIMKPHIFRSLNFSIAMKVNYNHFGFYISVLSVWSKNLSQLLQPIGSKTKTKHGPHMFSFMHLLRVF